MRRIIAEQIEPGTGAIVGARTVEVVSVECRLVGNEIATGRVDAETDQGAITIRISADAKDYQCARIYDETETLIESLTYRDGSVVYAQEQTSPTNDEGP
jgi:hypothetical protein